MGFGHALSGEVLRLDGGEWRPVVVAEQRDGFVVRDRRRVFPAGPAPADIPLCFSLPPDRSALFSQHHHAPQPSLSVTSVPGRGVPPQTSGGPCAGGPCAGGAECDRCGERG